MVETGLAALDARRESSLVVGDRLETDIEPDLSSRRLATSKRAPWLNDKNGDE